MKATRKQLEASIMQLATDFLNRSHYYSTFIEHDSNLTDIVNMLITDLFLNKFCFNTASLENLAAYEVVYEYKKELFDKGYVEFN